MQSSYKVSKWLYQRCLISSQGLRELFEELGFPSLYLTGKVIGKEDLVYTVDRFMALYEKYLLSLEGPEKITLPPLLLTNDPSATLTIVVSEGQYLIKPIKPLIQICEHQFMIGIDDTIHSMVYGKEVIRWGLQFSYPSLYIDPVTKKVVDVLKEESLTNTPLFKKLQRFLRYHSKPASFMLNEKKIQATFRLGPDLNLLHHDLSITV